jgi:glutathione S-transferase
LNQQPTLVSIRYSPWSERARWALDHHHVAYRLLEHEPFLHELRLRHLAGWPRERATVPLLLEGGRRHRSGWEIACYADTVGAGTPLIPAALKPAIGEVDALVDRALQAGRTLLVATLLEDSEALDASWPSFVPGALTGLLRPVARYATGWFARKYALDFAQTEAQLRVIRTELEEVRHRLNGRELLLGSFSYADILVATMLQLVEPVSDRHWKLHPAYRRLWTRPELANEYCDLLLWRDSVYDRYRRA